MAFFIGERFGAKQHAQADGNKANQGGDDHNAAIAAYWRSMAHSSQKYLLVLPGQKYYHT